MIYALMVYTVVAMATPHGSGIPRVERDWRQVAEFQDMVTGSKENIALAKDKCEQAAKEMELKERFKCIRLK